MLVSTPDALIAVGELILGQIDDLNRVEYNKKGRKYKFVNNNFQRIRDEDKHLIIYPENLDDNLLIISAYLILSSINEGRVLDEWPDLCLAIVGMAKQLEINHWYEEENSSVINYKISKFSYDDNLKEAALLFHDQVEPRHIEMGVNLLVLSKLNFLHTDHHIGTKLEGHYMKLFITEYLGEEALLSNDVLVALKSFVHWGNIKGILYKLEVPHIDISKDLKERFAVFPDPSAELKYNVYDRYPSGTSKYSLIRKSIDILADYKYSKLLVYPEGPLYDLDWIFELCHDIETDPIKYHLRSSVKSLCQNPVNLQELGNRYAAEVKSLLTYIALIINIFEETGGDFLLQNSKIPKLTDQLIDANKHIHDTLVSVREQVISYEEKGWDADDIVLRLAKDQSHSLYGVVLRMREKFLDDYE